MSTSKNILNRFVFRKFRTNRNSKKKTFIFFTKNRIEKIDENENEKIDVDDDVDNIND